MKKSKIAHMVEIFGDVTKQIRRDSQPKGQKDFFNAILDTFNGRGRKIRQFERFESIYQEGTPHAIATGGVFLSGRIKRI